MTFNLKITPKIQNYEINYPKQWGGKRGHTAELEVVNLRINIKTLRLKMYCDIEVRILGLTIEIMRNYVMK